MIMIIIKLITKKNIHTLTHTKTTHPSCLERLSLGSNGLTLGLDSRGGDPDAPVSSVARLHLVFQGGVCVCCVRLVGIGGGVGDQWQRLNSKTHSTF